MLFSFLEEGNAEMVLKSTLCGLVDFSLPNSKSGIGKQKALSKF